MSRKTQVLLVCDIEAERENTSRELQEALPEAHLTLEVNDEDGLKRVKSEEFDYVFTYLKGDALAGIYFLTAVWESNPNTSRFVISTSILSSDALVRCALGAHQYLRAPLERENLRAAIERADSIKDFVRNPHMRVLVSRMRALPSRPSLYLELMRELRSVNASVSAVSELVSKDLAIASKLIQVANSAYYGSDQQVSDPSAAVLLLGLETTSALVLSIEAFARFDKLKPLYFSIDRVWKHSQIVADLARKISKLMGSDLDTSGHAFTAGLLHDVGKLALAQNFEEQYQTTVQRAEKENAPVHTIEKEVFGATHAATGAYLLAVWGLPQPIVRAVAHHHLAPDLLDASFPEVVALHLAEQIVAGRKPLEELLAVYPAECGLQAIAEGLAELVNPDGNARPVQTARVSSAKAPPAQRSARSQTGPAAKPPAPTMVIRRDHAIWACAGIAAVFAIICAIAYGRRREPTERPATPPLPAIVAEQPVTPRPAPEEKTPAPQPSVPVQIQTPPPRSLKLQAVMYNGDKSTAIIEGKLVHIGESIDGQRVLSIRPNAVILERGAEKVLLALE
jgi:putative nucleotidyltransferase with HDIG domain